MTISNCDDIIDSREVIERIEELESDLEGLQQDLADSDESTREEAQEALNVFENENLCEDNGELVHLRALAQEAESYASDWLHGEVLINDNYFERYMDETISECYELPEIPSFMTIVLDYEALKQDYASVSFDGTDYWIRCT